VMGFIINELHFFYLKYVSAKTARSPIVPW
jgi:hypothetical protein